MSWIAWVLMMVSLWICKYIWHEEQFIIETWNFPTFWMYLNISKITWELSIGLNLTKKTKKKPKLMQFVKMSSLLHFQVFLWLMFNTLAPGKGQIQDKILSQAVDCLREATQHIIVPEKFDCILNAQNFPDPSKSKMTFTETSHRKSMAMFVETDFNLWYLLK